MTHLYRGADFMRALCGRRPQIGDTAIPSVHPDRVQADCIECRAAVGLTLSPEEPQPAPDEKLRVGLPPHPERVN
jgi:hypothetical protein